MSMLLFMLHGLWSIIDDSGSVVSSVVSSHPALLSFHMLAGNLDRALFIDVLRKEDASTTCLYHPTIWLRYEVSGRLEWPLVRRDRRLPASLPSLRLGGGFDR